MSAATAPHIPPEEDGAIELLRSVLAATGYAGFFPRVSAAGLEFVCERGRIVSRNTHAWFEL